MYICFSVRIVMLIFMSYITKVLLTVHVVSRL